MITGIYGTRSVSCVRSDSMLTLQHSKFWVREASKTNTTIHQSHNRGKREDTCIERVSSHVLRLWAIAWIACLFAKAVVLSQNEQIDGTDATE
jgi:hypothetical protein